MLIDLLLQLLVTILSWLQTLLPSWAVSFPSGMANSIGTLKSIDNLLPISEVFICFTAWVGLMIALTVFKWGLKVIDWVTNIIP